MDLGVNGGPKCSVYRNTITHGYQYAFAGLVIGDPTSELLETGRAVGIAVPLGSGATEQRVILTDAYPRYVAAFGETVFATVGMVLAAAYVLFLFGAPRRRSPELRAAPAPSP